MYIRGKVLTCYRDVVYGFITKVIQSFFTYRIWLWLKENFNFKIKKIIVQHDLLLKFEVISIVNKKKIIEAWIFKNMMYLENKKLQKLKAYSMQVINWKTLINVE